MIPELPPINEENMEESIRRFGAPPEELIELFKNRNTKAEECLAECERVLTEQSDLGAVLLYTGILLQERNQHAEALPYFVRVTEMSPLLHPGWQHRGMSEILLKDAIAAQESFMRLGQLLPNKAYPYCLIALAFYAQDKLPAGMYLLDLIAVSDKLDNEEKSLLLQIRGMLEENIGDDHAALLHYIESQILSNKRDALTGLKIRELASKPPLEEI